MTRDSTSTPPTPTASGSVPSDPRPDGVRVAEWPTASGHRIGVLTLDRPQRLNALDLGMVESLWSQLRAWRVDPGIVAVWLDAAGDRAFCAGGDVAAVARAVRAGGPDPYDLGDRFFTTEYALDQLIHEFGKPVIAHAQGVCMGGGLGLLVGASHRLLAEESTLAMPEGRIAMFPDVGGGWFLNRVPGGIGRLIALTGLRMNEADALFAGFADALLPVELLEEFTANLRNLTWRGEARADHEAVSMLTLGLARRTVGGLPTSALRQYFDVLQATARLPHAAAIADALGLLAVQDPWFEPLAAGLAAASPTATRVNDSYLQRCRRRSLREVFEIDRRLAWQVIRHPDFAEGVRALLIDKDHAPRWSAPTLGEVPQAVVDAHFAMPPAGWDALALALQQGLPAQDPVDG